MDGRELRRLLSLKEHRTRAVLVVPLSADGFDRHNPGAFGNVLCPIDFSEASTAALEQALRVVHETKGRLTLMHVLPNLDPMSRYAYHVGGANYGPLLERNAWQRLQECVPLDLRAGIDLRARVVAGAPAEQIAKVSGEIDANLIVMGVTARGAIGRRLLGSTAVHVIRSASRPVLAIPRAAAQGGRGVREIGRDDDDCGLSGDCVNEIESMLKDT